MYFLNRHAISQQQREQKGKGHRAMSNGLDWCDGCAGHGQSTQAPSLSQQSDPWRHSHAHVRQIKCKGPKEKNTHTSKYLDRQVPRCRYQQFTTPTRFVFLPPCAVTDEPAWVQAAHGTVTVACTGIMAFAPAFSVPPQRCFFLLPFRTSATDVEAHTSAHHKKPILSIKDTPHAETFLPKLGCLTCSC